MNYNRTDIIASLATTPGISAISIIRISGKNLKSIYKTITHSSDIKNRYAQYCSIFDDQKNIILDKCIIIYFQAPNSYTGEDIIEINCHGGQMVSQSILNMLYNHNIQPAYPGEFSYRAFINNKIDLIEAEGISQLINASSEYSQDIIMNSFNNNLKNNILDIKTKIKNTLTIIEHELDFSETEIEHISIEKILEELNGIKSTVTEYLQKQNLVKMMHNGINVVIMGIPNAGKSSLFNKIIGYNRTIVSAEHGTTRDSIESKVLIGQYPVNLIDTAGYFKADDDINIASIEQSIENAKNADIIIYLDDDNPIKKYASLNIKNKNVIFCQSKQDNTINLVDDSGVIHISSLKKNGIDTLYEKLSTCLLTEYAYDFNSDSILISNRQIKIFQKALNILCEVETMLKDNIEMDIIASYLHELTDLLSECLGEVTNDEVLHSIFSDFCVGK
tara:strand:+ start:433 stop:1773 length:1341 start_codon:yes stop_codon:yes gene_type:complete